MVVKQNVASFPYPVIFIVGGYEKDGGSQKVGALIVKQAIKADNTLDTPSSVSILMKDEEYVGGIVRTNPRPSTEFEKIKFEADVVVFKPMLDIIAISPYANAELFGRAAVNTANGVTTNTPNFNFGWQNKADAPRRALAGNTAKKEATNPDGFEPEVGNPIKLPKGFKNEFFNGRRFTANIATNLMAGEHVDFRGRLFRQNVTRPLGILKTFTIPTEPTLNFSVNGRAVTPSKWVSKGVDTVVLEVQTQRCLLTWRFVFEWETWMELCTLEVS